MEAIDLEGGTKGDGVLAKEGGWFIEVRGEAARRARGGQMEMRQRRKRRDRTAEKEMRQLRRWREGSSGGGEEATTDMEKEMTMHRVMVEMTETSGSSESEGLEPEAKRRRLRRLGSSVVRSATVLARTLLACEEKREQRHREMVELEERRLRMEEERTEMRRQGFAGLISAVNNLSGAIHALVSDHRNGDGR
ncbi:hypothetical protein COCNU_scaffold014438G000040 [Cocos nucifera]|nr:hypothetical protein [Cocos nucifera]